MNYLPEIIGHAPYRENVSPRSLEEFWKMLAESFSISEQTFITLWRYGPRSVRKILSENSVITWGWYYLVVSETEDMGALIVLAYRLDGKQRDLVLDVLVKSPQVRARKTVAELSTNPTHLRLVCYSPYIDVRRPAVGNPMTRVEDRVVATLLGV